MLDSELFELAAIQARQATCLNARCGSVIYSPLTQTVIGAGSNNPPLGLESQRQCEKTYGFASKRKADRTCCVHAEWNAILNALELSKESLVGTSLYFMRVDDNGNWTDAGEPYCTVCSRLSLQSGISYFYLWVNGEPKRYNTIDYNSQTYDSTLL